MGTGVTRTQTSTAGRAPVAAWCVLLVLGAAALLSGCDALDVDFKALAGHLAEFLYIGTFVLLFMTGMAMPIPEEPILLAAGFACYQSQANVVILIVCAMAGILGGDSFIWWVGKRHGDWVFKSRLFRYLLPEERLAIARAKINQNGAKVAFFGRFIAGLRFVTFFTCGNMGIRYGTFLFMDFLAAMLTIPTSIWATWYFGQHIEQALQFVGVFQRVLWTAILGGLGAWILIIALRAWRAAPRAVSPPES